MAFELIQALRSGTSANRWAATGFSLVTAIGLLLLLPVTMLFVDLLIWKGRIPTYGQLAPARQKQFRDFWNADAMRVDEFKVAGQSEAEAWETRWETATVERLRRIVSPEAADAYIHQHESFPNGYRKAHVIDETRLGLLPTVVREQGRWTGVLTAELARAMPWTWRPGPDGNANDAFLGTLFATALSLAVVGGLAALAARHYASDAAIDLTCRLRRAISQHASRMGSVGRSPEAAQEAAELLTTRSAEAGEADERIARTLWRNRVLIGGTILLMLAIHPLLGAAILAGGAAVWLIVGQIVAAARRDARSATKILAAADGRLRESIDRQLLVKAYLMDRFAQNRIERQLDECTSAERRVRRGAALSRPLMTVVGGIGGVVLLFALGGLAIAGGVSVAGLVALLAASGLLLWAVRSLLHDRHVAKLGRSAIAQIGAFLDRRTDPGQTLDAEFLQPIGKRIEFHGVAVREPGTGTMLLDDVTASIAAGSRVAVVGADRDALKAFAHALMRFVEPTAGDIKADGKNLRWVTVDSLRTQLAYVAEDSLTMTDTVTNNIGCGDPGFGLPQVMEAAKVAHAHQFVQRLPYGYETLVGGPGVALTIGQQYRVALARAILRDPSVLIVEEPSASLDADSEALVEDTFARIRPGRTIIQLARREATLRAADTVYVLERGRIVATGTHDALMKSSDVYRRLGYRAAP